MDKHYGSPEGQARPNGQRWNEHSRDDDRDMRGARGGEYGGGSEESNRRWMSSGGDLDREDMTDEQSAGQWRGNFGPRERWGQRDDQNRGSQGGWNRGRESASQWRGDSQRSEGQRFGGGHYGGFANEGFPGQGNYGGNRGFSNQGYAGQPHTQQFNQPSSGERRGYTGQGNFGQTFGQGYAGGEYGQGSSGQDFGQGSFNRGYGNQGSGRTSQGRGFAGRGPKGYQRSDERIKEQLSERLMDDDDVDASEITIEVKNGEVTLTGTVNSREEKRAAEQVAEQSPGVREVQNHLRLNRSRPRDNSVKRTSPVAADSRLQDRRGRA